MSFFDRLFGRKPARYADVLLKELQQVGDTRQWQSDPANDRLVLIGADGQPTTSHINLTNMAAEYAATPKAKRGEAIRRQALAMLPQGIPDDFGAACPNLLPVVRSNTERGTLKLQFATTQQPTDDGIAFKPLCADLEISIVYDTEHAMARITTRQLAKWGKTFDEVYDAALDNLRARSTKPMEQLAPGVFCSRFGDYYDASRILLTDLLHRHSVAGAPVVMIPNRTVLLLTGDRDIEGPTRVLVLAEGVLQEARPITPLMLRYVDGRWESYQPDALRLKLNLERIRIDMNDYANQKQMMEHNHERLGIDIFVATYQAFVEKDGVTAFSSCTWTEGVASLLPKTDRINLFRPDVQQLSQVSWDTAIAAFGHLLTPTDDLPVRYKVVAFPSAEMLQALADAAAPQTTQ